MAFPFRNIQTFIRHCIEVHTVSLKALIELDLEKVRVDLQTKFDALKAELQAEIDELKEYPVTESLTILL
jgi:hypothetical protein